MFKPKAFLAVFTLAVSLFCVALAGEAFSEESTITGKVTSVVESGEVTGVKVNGYLVTNEDASAELLEYVGQTVTVVGVVSAGPDGEKTITVSEYSEGSEKE